MKCLVTFSILLLFISGMVTSDSPLDKANHVGCYDLGYSLRKNFHNHMAGVTIDNCVDFCCKRKTKYAGVEQSDNFCYCGADIAEESIKRNDSLCNVRCRGKANLFCGGDWLMSLYDISGTCENPCTPSSDIGQIRFLVALSTGVRLYQKECSKEFDVLHTTNDWTYTLDYHYAKNLVFFLVSRRMYKTVFQTASPASASGLVPIRNMSSCDGFAVDWLSDRIYWADCNNGNNNIMSMDLDGSGNTVILNRPEEPGMIKRMEVDPYKGMLFWTTDGTIESYNLEDDRDFRTNISRAGASVRALTLDMAAHRVYYVGVMNGSASLFSMNYQGDDQREIFSMPELMSVYGLGLLSGNVFWVNYARSRDVLYKSSLTDPESLQILTPIDRAVWHMRVVHPSLQQRPNVTTDPCKVKLCSYGCVAESPTTATCQCPDDQTLDPDGITCTASQTQVAATAEPHPCDKDCSYYCAMESPSKGVCQCPDGQDLDADGVTCNMNAVGHISSKHSVSVGVILLGILLVMVIVGISGLLLYLSDKYWTYLHMKLTGASYTRKRDGVCEDESNYHSSTTFNTTEDNVVLVS